MIIKKYSIILYVIFALFTSCDNSKILDENKDFTKEIWHKDSALIFDIDITDTLAIYNIYMNNRISQKYEFSNLYLFINTELPNNQIIRDTLECILLAPNGRFLGKGFGNIWSNRITYRRHIRFPYSGNYKFTIEQAMRDEQLKHILSAGIRIEKAKSK